MEHIDSTLFHHILNTYFMITLFFLKVNILFNKYQFKKQAQVGHFKKMNQA